MGTFLSFCRALFSAIFLTEKWVIGRLLRISYQRKMPLRLVFSGRSKQTENLACTVLRYDYETILLSCPKIFVPDALSGEHCCVFIKLAPTLLPQYILNRQDTPGGGFLCNSRILYNQVNRQKRTSEICVVFPSTYVQRELRRYERVRPPLRAIVDMGLWNRSAHLPISREHLGLPVLFYRDSGLKQFTLMDISAGGAKLLLKNISTQACASRYDGSHLIFLISLTQVGKKENLSLLLAARCLEALWHEEHRTVTMRLTFTHIGQTQRFQQSISWQKLEDGVPAMVEWVERDYPIYMSQTAQMYT